MTVWHLIALSAVTAFAFRVVPFVFRESSLLSNKNGRFYRFLIYSSQSMLGILSYSTLFDSASISDLLNGAEMRSVLGLVFVAAAFVAVSRAMPMAVAFLIAAIAYSVLVFSSSI